MAHSSEVYDADDLRRRGEITWEQYAALLRGKFVRSMDEYSREWLGGIRDKEGRLHELKDLGGQRR